VYITEVLYYLAVITACCKINFYILVVGVSQWQ